MANLHPKRGKSPSHLYAEPRQQSATGDAWWSRIPLEGMTKYAESLTFHFKGKVEVPRFFDEWSLR